MTTTGDTGDIRSCHHDVTFCHDWLANEARTQRRAIAPEPQAAPGEESTEGRDGSTHTPLKEKEIDPVASMTALFAAHPSDTTSDRKWRDRSSCLDEDPELFFPLSENGGASASKLLALQVAAAKAVCDGCPVREQCFAWAMETGQDYGIWGGVTEKERRQLRRRQKGAAA